MSDIAERVLAELARRSATVAVAASLTGGPVGALLTAVPGASATFRGGVIAYATDVKADVLGVDRDLLAAEGAVHPEVARQLAGGVRDLLRATYGLGLTGVAGPDPQDGRPPGTVYVAVAGPEGSEVSSVDAGPTEQTSSDEVSRRAEIRSRAARAALELLLGVVR